jgi:glycolate oxidase
MARVDAALIRGLKAIVGERRCLTAPEDLRCYSYDMFARGLPEAVVLPENNDEVCRMMALAYTHGVPVTPRGAASSLTGGPVPVRGGIALSLARMNRILEISPLDRLARTEPGVVTAEFQKALARRHLFYPPNPTSAAYCTLGGNVATNAGGASGVKYGVTRDYLLGLKVVLPNGEILETGGRCLKRVTGYDFTQLLCGSEGLLGVITEITFKLLTPPEAVQTLLAYYPTLEQTGQAVAEIIQAGMIPATLELMDEFFLRAVERVYGLKFPVGAAAALLIELDGPAAILPGQQVQVEALCRKAGPLEFRCARNEADREVLWQARRGGTAALARQSKFILSLDYAVPISAISRAVRSIQDLARRRELDVVVIGHAGDGNLHPMFIYDPDDPVQRRKYLEAEDELCDLMLSLHGTLSGEHGIGLEKAKYLHRELSRVELDLSAGLKRLFDPRSIMNPGKCESIVTP